MITRSGYGEVYGSGWEALYWCWKIYTRLYMKNDIQKKNDKFVHACNHFIYGGVLTQTEQGRMGPTRKTRSKHTFILPVWSGKHGSVLPLYCQHHLSNQHGTFPRSTSTSACRAALATRALLGGLLGIGRQGSRYAKVLWQTAKPSNLWITEQYTHQQYNVSKLPICLAGAPSTWLVALLTTSPWGVHVA